MKREYTYPKSRIKKGDQVVAISGEDAGSKHGKVLQILPKQGKALVEGFNLVKKHMKATQDNPQGGIVEKEAPIQVSNVAIFNPATNKADRVGYKVEEGAKVRIFKSTGEAIDS